ncbi:MAG: hypothetical protein IJO55_02260, partial [Lachnospiraceae bacterium]|nr:hypothetical protein [Lachnospiraceae bacterium]
MTVRERVLASRLIQKIDNHEKYAGEIGLSYEFSSTRTKENTNRNVLTVENNHDLKGRIIYENGR